MTEAFLGLEEPGYNKPLFLACLLVGWVAIAFGIQQLMTSRVDNLQWSSGSSERS